MRKLLSNLAAVLFFCLSGLIPIPAQVSVQPQNSSLALTNVTVIDATGARPKQNMTVVVSHGRITGIGKTGKLKVPKDAQVVDATGKFLIPGLWDMHVHLGGGEMMLPLYIANGVTGVRDMAGEIKYISVLKRAESDGTTVGPWIAAAAGRIADGPKPIWAFSIPINNEAEARKGVETLRQEGSEFIKVYDLLPRNAYFAIAEETKKRGLTFAGHVPISVSAAEASDAGQKSVEHLSGILLACASNEDDLRAEAVAALKKNDPAVPSYLVTGRAERMALSSYSEKKAAAFFKRLIKNGTWQVPTFTNARGYTFIDDADFVNDPRLKYMPSGIRRWWKSVEKTPPRILTAEERIEREQDLQRRLDFIGAMFRVGVPILAGTDTPNPYCFPGFGLHDELELLVKAGLTPMAALQTATLNPAKFFGLSDSHGTVERGKLANLVLLDADPLRDINNTRRISAVVLQGRIYDRSAIDMILTEVEKKAGVPPKTVAKSDDSFTTDLHKH